MRAKSISCIVLSTVAVMGCRGAQAEAGLAPNVEAQGTIPDLSGKWVVNRGLTEWPGRTVRGADRRRGPADSATRAARIEEFKSRMTAEDSARFASRRGELRARMAGRGITLDSLRRIGEARRVRRKDQPQILEIHQSSGSITFGGGRRGATLSTDGSPMLHGSGQRQVSTTAKWVGQALVVERVGPRGVRASTAHQLSADGRRLTSIVTVTHPDGATSRFTVVRERAE